jgi:hypothetical protein
VVTRSEGDVDVRRAVGERSPKPARPAWLAPARCHRLLQSLVAAEGISPETTNVKGTNEKTVAWRKFDSQVIECSFHGQSRRDDPHRWLDLYRGSKATDRLGHSVAAVSHLKVIRNQQNHSDLLAGGPDEAAGLNGRPQTFFARAKTPRSTLSTLFRVLGVIRLPRCTRFAGRAWNASTYGGKVPITSYVPWPGEDSNLRATDYESAALTAELPGRHCARDASTRPLRYAAVRC